MKINSIRNLTLDVDDEVLHNEFTSYSEIAKAVKLGKRIYWANSAYDVVYWEKSNSIMVVCNVNGSTISLSDSEYDIIRCYTHRPIQASVNEGMIDASSPLPYMIEIGKGTAENEDYQDNLTDFESFGTLKEAKERVTYINNLDTHDWSRI